MADLSPTEIRTALVTALGKRATKYGEAGSLKVDVRRATRGSFTQSDWDTAVSDAVAAQQIEIENGGRIVLI